jgi:hypothetical protein
MPAHATRATDLDSTTPGTLYNTHTLSPKGSRDISDIPQRHSNYTKMKAMRNTAYVTGGKPIGV